jgi:hypothetical protein
VYTLLNASFAFGEEFDIRFLPSKLVENSDAKMRVFITDNTQIIPKKITDLTVTSLDSSILHIEKVQEGNDFYTEVIIKTDKSGETKLYLAAPGFDSKEIPIEVYGNKNNAETFLVKITPDTFTTSGNTDGYISVELADEDGFPVLAREDTTISLSTANRDIIDLANPNLIIKEGEYFAYTKFQTKKSGETMIYATSNGIETQSDSITVEEDEDLTVKLYTYPKTLSIHDTSRGFIIAQLQDSSGRPVLAQKDTSVYYTVTDSDYSESTNYSSNYKQKSTGYFQIDKGSYWGYVQYSLPQGIEDTYDVSISVEDPLSAETEKIEAKDLELIDDKLVKFDSLPILATGGTELIGVVYLEDEDGNPVIAEKDMFIQIGSSDLESLSVQDITFPEGDQVALVYGKVGHSIPSDLELRPIVNEGELETPTVFGPDKDSLELVVEPLISDVLAETNFPMVLYLKDGDEVTGFPENNDVFLSPNEYVQIQSKKILQKDRLVLVDAKSFKKGLADLSVEVGEFEDSPLIDNLSAEPVELVLDHSPVLFSGINDVFSVQLVNSEGLPTYATNDIEINMVVKNQELIDAPSKVIIPKGSYYSLFDVAPKAGGETEISLLSKELPLFKDEIKIISLIPTLGIIGPDSVESFDVFTVTISAKSNEKPLAGMSVQWKVDGGIMQMADSVTGSTGEAVVSIISQTDGVNVEATVSNGLYTPTTITKTIQIISEPTILDVEQTPTYEQIEIFGIDPVLIIVPVAIGAAGFMLKKKGQITIKK